MPRQWSLRTLFVATAVIGAACAMIVWSLREKPQVLISLQAGGTYFDTRDFTTDSTKVLLQQTFRLKHMRKFKVAVTYRTSMSFLTKPASIEETTKTLMSSHESEDGQHYAEIKVTVYPRRFTIEQTEDETAPQAIWSGDFSTEPTDPKHVDLLGPHFEVGIWLPIGRSFDVFHYTEFYYGRKWATGRLA
jgi:hypothetical protein